MQNSPHLQRPFGSLPWGSECLSQFSWAQVCSSALISESAKRETDAQLHGDARQHSSSQYGPEHRTKKPTRGAHSPSLGTPAESFSVAETLCDPHPAPAKLAHTALEAGTRARASWPPNPPLSTHQPNPEHTALFCLIMLPSKPQLLVLPRGPHACLP